MASAPDSSVKTALRELLEAQLGQDSTPVTGLVVALSGGLDSTVLLALLHELSQDRALALPLRAIHVDHGIDSRSDSWRLHCERECARLGVSLCCYRADLAAATSAPVSEDAARTARYGFFEQSLGEGECLLLAHHQDDQLETLLLRLCRGAGVEGLAGMPQRRALGAGFLLRPLLGVSRRSLEQIARARSLAYLSDPSNEESHYDRNLLRREVFPVVEARWPSYRQSWGKTQRLLAESAELNAALADIDLARCRIGESGRLSVPRLNELTGARRRNLLRRWAHRLGLPGLSWALLERLEVELGARAGAGESSRWDGGGFLLFRERDEVAAVRDDRFVPGDAGIGWGDTHRTGTIELPGNGVLRYELLDAPASAREGQRFRVGYRRGGESIRLAGRRSKSLKKAFNEARVPVWLRDRTPIVFWGETAIWVAGLGFAEHAPQMRLEWLSPALELGL